MTRRSVLQPNPLLLICLQRCTCWLVLLYRRFKLCAPPACHMQVPVKAYKLPTEWVNPGTVCAAERCGSGEEGGRGGARSVGGWVGVSMGRQQRPKLGRAALPTAGCCLRHHKVKLLAAIDM